MTSIETERKYTVTAGHALDAVAELAPPYVLGPPRRFELAADYVDTLDLTLARAGYSLRRRVGGADEGWHLKFPRDGDSRIELAAPLSAGRSTALVPRALRTHVEELLRLDALVPVARLVTERTERDVLRGEDSAVVAVLADDHVTSSAIAGRADAWREIEVELVDGSSDDLEAVETQLLGLGLIRSSSSSKVARSLGLERAESAAQRGPLTSGEVLMSYLRSQIGAMQGLEGDVRRDEPDAVHQARVATRKLRSALRSFRRLLDRDITDPFAVQVRWLAEMLGGPRDAEVMRARIMGDLETLRPDQIVGDARHRLAGRLTADHSAAHEVLVHALNSERMAILMESAVQLLRHPPLHPRAARPAAAQLPPLVHRVERQVEQAREAAATEHDEARRLHLLHDVRKKAKAARYAHQVLDAVPDHGSRQMASQWEKVTESLGEFQDTVVVIARLHELADAAAAAGEQTTTEDLLLKREQARGHVALARATKQVDKLTRG